MFSDSPVWNGAIRHLALLQHTDTHGSKREYAFCGGFADALTNAEHTAMQGGPGPATRLLPPATQNGKCTGQVLVQMWQR